MAAAPTEAQVRESLGACRWSALQFSGDESDDLLLSFPADLVIRAARLKDKRDLVALKHRPRNAAWLVAPGLAAAASGFGLSGAFWVAAALFGGASLVAVLMLRASTPR